MKEYIERDKAIKALTGWDTDPTDEEIEYTLKKIPAADVVERKRGHIIETAKDGKMNRVFSCCGKDFTQLTMWMIPDFCPNCGADMRSHHDSLCDQTEEVEHENQ